MPAEEPLYALAEAVVLSLALLSVVWWLGGANLAKWAAEGTLHTHHRGDAYWFFVAMIVAPYPAGVIAGFVVDWLEERLDAWTDRYFEANPEPQSRSGRLLARVEALGITNAPSVWDETWDSLIEEEGALYVRVVTTGGHEIVGAFAADSLSGRSPEPHQLYISEVYRFNSQDRKWETEAGTKGVFIDASQIESVEFAEFLGEAWIGAHEQVREQNPGNGAASEQPEAAVAAEGEPRPLT